MRFDIIANNCRVEGDLTVLGATTTISTTNTEISDTLIELNSGQTGTNTKDIGLILDRGAADNAAIVWDESATQFTLGTTTAASTASNVDVTAGTLYAKISVPEAGDLKIEDVVVTLSLIHI